MYKMSCFPPVVTTAPAAKYRLYPGMSASYFWARMHRNHTKSSCAKKKKIIDDKQKVSQSYVHDYVTVCFV